MNSLTGQVHETVKLIDKMESHILVPLKFSPLKVRKSIKFWKCALTMIVNDRCAGQYLYLSSTIL